MKTTNVLTIGLVATALAVCAAAVLLWLARSNDPADYRKSIAGVREIQQLAADWSIETARVRSDPVADFDSLAAFIPRMDTLKEELLTTVRGMPDVPDRLANDVSAYLNAVEAREERIERFKTGYAVIRNSARYLPLAASNIVQSPDIDAELSREVSALTNDINGYLNAPSDAEKGRLTVALERLADRADGVQPPLTDHLASFAAHAGVLLAKQAPTGELFALATSSDISDLSASLVNDLNHELTKRNTLNTRYMNGVFGAGAFLVLAWIAVGALGRRPAAEPMAAAAAVAVNSSIPRSTADSGDAWAVTKLLMSHRILSHSVASRLAGAARSLSQELESLRAARDEFNGAQARDNAGSGAPKGDPALARVRERLDGITEMADRLSAFSEGRSDVSYTLLDLNDCVRDVIEETSAEAVTEVTVEPGTVPEIFASKAEICLMLEKVVENALQAVADSGKDQGELKISTGADGGKATVTVIDNGVGMPPETRARMFEPFFAADDSRAGVGLVATGHLVEKYGGSVSVSSMAGGGTVTRIQLPGMAEG